jgi:hypothetical protein
MNPVTAWLLLCATWNLGMAKTLTDAVDAIEGGDALDD